MNETDTTVLLWEHLFKCRIPNLQTMSPEYIKQVGIFKTGDPGIDREIANQWITTMLSIAKMTEYFSEGVPIKVVKYEDVKTIYTYISRHLDAWKDQIQNGMNIGDAPIEDLILLDQFANTVYDRAKYQFTKDTVNSLLGQHIQNMFKINKSNILRMPRANSGEDPKEDKFPQRESLSEMFKDRLVGMRNR